MINSGRSEDEVLRSHNIFLTPAAPIPVAAHTMHIKTRNAVRGTYIYSTITSKVQGW